MQPPHTKDLLMYIASTSKMKIQVEAYHPLPATSILELLLSFDSPPPTR
jgi:hypothetical protein